MPFHKAWDNRPAEIDSESIGFSNIIALEVLIIKSDPPANENIENSGYVLDSLKLTPKNADNPTKRMASQIIADKN